MRFIPLTSHKLILKFCKIHHHMVGDVVIMTKDRIQEWNNLFSL